MGVKDVKYYQSAYYQGDLSDKDCNSLHSLLTEIEEVPVLKNVITNMKQHTVTSLISEAEEYEKKNKTIIGFENRYKPLAGVGELRPEQTKGVAFLYYAGSCLLGDEVGLGKTVLSAGIINVRTKEYERQGKKFRALIVCEKASSDEIRNKLVKFTGEFVGLMKSATQTEIAKMVTRNPNGDNYNLVVTHSALASADFLAYLIKNPFDMIILDESSVIKNTKSTLNKNLKALFKKTRYKILLNATPFELTLRDIYNHLDLIDPTYLPLVGAFEGDFCVKGWNHFTKRQEVKGYQYEEEFKKLVSFRYFARTRKSLGAKYEDNNHLTVYVPMSKEQKAYASKVSLHRMLVEYPSRIDPDIPFNGDTTPKVAVTQQLVDEIVSIKGETALIYCHYVEAQRGLKEILEDMGYRVAILNGQDTKKLEVRRSICSDFNAGLYDVLITNVLKGLDLNSCDNCIMYSLDPNPQNMIQFEGRITREFDVIGKNAWILVSFGHEKRQFDKVIQPRTKASAKFTTGSNSLVLQALTSYDNYTIAEVGDN